MFSMLNSNDKKALPGRGLAQRDNANSFAFSLEEQQAKFFRYIVNNYNIHKVLDVFCGNGELAVLLAQWEKDVTILIPEPPGVKEMNNKSVRAGVRLEICQGDMRDLLGLYRGQCDLIICLQNSLSYFLNEEDIWGTLAQMYLKLNPGGVLVIHTLNYDNLLERDMNLVPVLEKQHLGLRIRLWLKPEKERKKARLIFKIISTDVYARQEEVEVSVRPILKKELALWLTELGYKKIIDYGWFDCQTDLNNSCHRITVAHRPEMSGPGKISGRL